VGRPRLTTRAARLAHGLTAAGSLGAMLATAHTAHNLRVLRVPPQYPRPVHERVSVLVPARDEAGCIEACLRALCASTSLPDLEIVVLDDGSSDATAALVRALAGVDSRITLIDGGGQAPPNGWLGKTWACARLAEAATGSVLVFVDADVTVSPSGIAASVELLRASGLDVVCPYPRQLAVTPGERLVQPLLQWSWLTTLPLRVAESSPRESLAAANGQLLAVDEAAYRRAGGHRAVQAEVLDDVALLRAVKRSGGRGTMADGTHVATCRMYASWPEIEAGYTKSLWSAFGSPAGAAVAVSALTLVYVVPAVAALRGSRIGTAGYAAGVAGRVLVARRVGGRAWPDSLAHPLSIAAFGYLTAASVRRRAAGTLRWKGRAL